MKKLFFMLTLLLSSVAAMAQGEVETWNLKVQLGSEFSLNKIMGSKMDKVVLADIGASYNASEFFAVGVATGLWGPQNQNDSMFLPFLGSATFMIPSKNENAKVVPLCDIRLGAALAMKSHSANLGVLEVAPGAAFKLNDMMDLTANLLYQGTLTIGNGKGCNGNYIGARVGLSFHLY